MGWCSATEIFDAVASAVLEEGEIDKKSVLKVVISALEDGDWDCENDSAYWDHPLVREIFKEKYPHWFEGEEQ